MKILIAISYAPYPVKRGIDRLILNLVRGLSERHSVILCSMTIEKGEEKAVKGLEGRNVSVRTIMAPNRRSPFHRLFYKVKNAAVSMLRAVPMQVLYAAPGAYLDLIARVAREEKVDITIAFYWHLFELPRRLERKPSILATLDLDYLVHPSRLKRRGRGLKPILSYIDVRMKERIEMEAYRRFDAILTVTESDGNILRGLHGIGDKPVITLPLAIDPDMFSCRPVRREPGGILMLGAFDADFNHDALTHYLTEIHPLIAARKPDARLVVVGQGVNERARRIAGAGVEFTGRVEDINPYLAGCSVMVLPLRFGGGVRIRMMEAAAMGTPVVSTPIGVAGMGLRRGEHYLEAETPPEMSEAVLRILEDGELAQRIGMNARRWAVDNISMDTYPGRLDALLLDIERRFSNSGI